MHPTSPAGPVETPKSHLGEHVTNDIHIPEILRIRSPSFKLRYAGHHAFSIDPKEPPHERDHLPALQQSLQDR